MRSTSFSLWWWCRHLLALLAASLACQLAHADDDVWAAHADATFRRVIPASLAITDIVQDGDGFLWLGTQSGLVRWDGYKQRAYVGDVAAPGALPDSYVLVLHVDARGRLWIGTSAGGLARYDAANDRFDPSLAPGAALSRKSVFALAEDDDGALWVGTGGGLDRLDAVTGLVQRHAELARRQGLPDGAVNALLREPGGALWVGTDTGLYRRATGQDRFVPVPLPTAERGPLVVSKLMQDSERRTWIGTRAQGAFIVEPGAAAPVPLQQRVHGASIGLDTEAVFTLAEAGPGEVWLGTDGHGIVRVDTRRWTARRTQHREHVLGGLPDNDVFALHRDRRGLVWVGTDTGLSVHDARQRTIHTWFGGDTRTDGISHLNVPFVLPMADGRVWLSVGDGGIDIVQPGRGRIAQLRPDPAALATALPPGRVLCMALSPAGDFVYIGTQRGLYRADAAGRTVQRLEVAGRALSASVWAMAWQGRRLWLGGLDGLWAMEPAESTRLTPTAHDDGSRLGDQRITTLLPDGAAHLWVGTRTGLVRLDTATMAATRLPQDGPGRIGLPTGYVSSVLRDQRGRLWVASFGAGVRVVEALAGAPTTGVRRITTAEGLPHNGVNAIVMDGQGDVWASTDDGLARIAQDTLAVEPFGAADGLGIPSYWTHAGAAMPDGHLLFGGSGGLTIVDPGHAAPAPESAPVVVTELRLGDEAPRPGYRGDASAAPLTIAPGRRSVLVEFAALDYAAPQRNRYEYRLRGVDPAWVATEASRRLAAYTNLAPGDYVLELRAAGAKGAWSQPLELPLHVRATWQETAWFRGALVLALVALLVGGVQVRTLYHRRRQRALEALVDERTQQLQASQRQLEQIAYYDGLTGLGNRRLFNDELKRLLAHTARSGRGFTLLLIDLDHFKRVNDTFGHDAGDAVLAVVGKGLLAAVRETDRVARLGGDEFAVLLPETIDVVAVEAVCQRIFEALATPLPQGGAELQPSASIGGAMCPRDAQTADALYKAADVALYDAKRAGRNRWRLGAAVASAA